MSFAMMELIEFIRIRKSILMHCFVIVLFSCISPFTELEIMIYIIDDIQYLKQRNYI